MASPLPPRLSEHRRTFREIGAALFRRFYGWAGLLLFLLQIALTAYTGVTGKASPFLPLWGWIVTADGVFLAATYATVHRLRRERDAALAKDDWATPAARPDLQAAAEVAWVRAQAPLTVCWDAMDSGEKKTATLEALCILWQEPLATSVAQDALEIVAKHVYPCIPQVHSGFLTKTETEDCRHRFVRGALNLLVLEELVQETPRPGSETVKPAAYGDDRFGDLVIDTTYSVFRWTPLGRATVKRLLQPTTEPRHSTPWKAHLRDLEKLTRRLTTRIEANNSLDAEPLMPSFEVHFPNEYSLICSYQGAIDERDSAYKVLADSIDARFPDIAPHARSVLYGAGRSFADGIDTSAEVHNQFTLNFNFSNLQEPAPLKERDAEETAALHAQLDKWLGTIKDSQEVLAVKVAGKALALWSSQVLPALADVKQKHRVLGPRCETCREYPAD